MGTALNYQEVMQQMMYGDTPRPDPVAPAHGEIARSMREAATWVLEAPEDERCFGHLSTPDGRFCALGKLIQLTGCGHIANYLNNRQCNMAMITYAFDHRGFVTCANMLKSMADFIEMLPQPEPAAEIEPVDEELEEYMMSVEFVNSLKVSHATAKKIEWIKDEAELDPLEDSWALEAHSPPEPALV